MYPSRLRGRMVGVIGRNGGTLGIGVGFQNGAAALSLGYQRALSDRATVTLGGAFSGDDSSVGAGVGFGW